MPWLVSALFNPDVNWTVITLDRGIGGKRCASGLQNNAEIALDHAFVAHVAGQDLHVSGAGDAAAILEIVDIELHLAVTDEGASLVETTADFPLENASRRDGAPGVVSVMRDIELGNICSGGDRALAIIKGQGVKGEVVSGGDRSALVGQGTLDRVLAVSSTLKWPPELLRSPPLETCRLRPT